MGINGSQIGPFNSQIEVFYNWLVATGQVLRRATVVLTNAQILALPTTSVEIVPDPGPASYLVPVQCQMEQDFTGGFYGNITDNTLAQGASDVVVTWGNNVINAFRPVPLNFLGGFFGHKGVLFCSPQENVSVPIAVTDGLWAKRFDFPFSANNLMIAADNGAGNFTGGAAGNTLAVTVWYVQRTFGSPNN